MYPQILKDKGYNNNELILSFYDERGCFKSIDELMKKSNILTPYMISSENFLKGIDKNTINQKQGQFILNNINMVANEHKCKIHYLKQMYPQAKRALEEMSKYTHVTKTASRKSVEFTADENYYQFLEKSAQANSLINNSFGR